MQKTMHIPLILLSLFTTTIASSCRQRTSPKAPASTLHHVLGATSVAPLQDLESCIPATDMTDATTYFDQVAQYLMAKNMETFKGPYAPDQFCIHAREYSNLNAASSPANRLVALNTGLVWMAPDQVDADIAMPIAHELAHITLQHGERDPRPSELPDDIDQKELDRRLRLRAVFRDQKLNLRKSIAVNAETDQIFDDYVWLVANTEEITTALKPLTSSRDSSAIDTVLKIATQLRSTFTVVLGDPTVAKNNPVSEANLMIQSRVLIQTLTQDFAKIKSAIKDVGNCQPPSPCDTLSRLGQIASYQSVRVQPVALQLNTLFMPLEDNPDSYPPYAQWMEQQADEVGYELYLKAGFKPERFETYFKAALQRKSETSTAECLKAIQDKTPPSRTEDEDLDRSHPSRCFRFYNIHIAEILRHHEAYKELGEKASTLNLPETAGKLKELRDRYPQNQE